MLHLRYCICLTLTLTLGETTSQLILLPYPGIFGNCTTFSICNSRSTLPPSPHCSGLQNAPQWDGTDGILLPSNFRLVLAEGKRWQDIGRREESEDRIFIPQAPSLPGHHGCLCPSPRASAPNWKPFLYSCSLWVLVNTCPCPFEYRMVTTLDGFWPWGTALSLTGFRKPACIFVNIPFINFL